MINWKTTLAAFIAGALPIIQGTVDSWGAGVPIQWAKIGMGLAIMALGLFAKDFNVTGAGPAAHTLTHQEFQIAETKAAIDASQKESKT